MVQSPLTYVVLKCSNCKRTLEINTARKSNPVKIVAGRPLMTQEALTSQVHQISPPDAEALIGAGFPEEATFCICDIELFYVDAGLEYFDLQRFLDSGTFEDVTPELGKILFGKENE